MTYLIAAWALCVLAILVALAWSIGFNAGYERCREDERWTRWFLRREENRNTRI